VVVLRVGCYRKKVISPVILLPWGTKLIEQNGTGNTAYCGPTICQIKEEERSAPGFGNAGAFRAVTGSKCVTAET
jgi:hypothetical protein